MIAAIATIVFKVMPHRAVLFLVRVVLMHFECWVAIDESPLRLQNNFLSQKLDKEQWVFGFMPFSIPHARGLTELLCAGVHHPSKLSISEPMFDPRGHYFNSLDVSPGGQWLYGIYYGKKALGQLTLRKAVERGKTRITRIEYRGQIPDIRKEIGDVRKPHEGYRAHFLATDGYADDCWEQNKLDYHFEKYRTLGKLIAAANRGERDFGPSLPRGKENKEGILYRVDESGLPFADNERLHPHAAKALQRLLQKQDREDARRREEYNKKRRNLEMKVYSG
jgi:hypothetical protein